MSPELVLKMRNNSRRRWKEMCVHHKISKEDLSEFLGVSVSTVSRWGSSAWEANPDAVQTTRICIRWKVAPNWLLLGVGPMSLQDSEISVQRRVSVRAWDERMDRLEGSIQSIHEKLG